LPVVREVLRAPGLYLAATLAVARAALEVRREYGRHPFDELVERLRGSGARGAGATADPRAVARAVAQARVASRLLPLLPPLRMGRCLKRSLLLLLLWSRSGLAVRIHLGFQPLAGGAPRGHAWLSTERPELAPQCGGANGHTEVLVL
jgi:hypothetical protein